MVRRLLFFCSRQWNYPLDIYPKGVYYIGCKDTPWGYPEPEGSTEEGPIAEGPAEE